MPSLFFHQEDPTVARELEEASLMFFKTCFDYNATGRPKSRWLNTYTHPCVTQSPFVAVAFFRIRICICKVIHLYFQDFAFVFSVTSWTSSCQRASCPLGPTSPITNTTPMANQWRLSESTPSPSQIYASQMTTHLIAGIWVVAAQVSSI